MDMLTTIKKKDILTISGNIILITYTTMLCHCVMFDFSQDQQYFFELENGRIFISSRRFLVYCEDICLDIVSFQYKFEYFTYTSKKRLSFLEQLHGLFFFCAYTRELTLAYAFNLTYFPVSNDIRTSDKDYASCQIPKILLKVNIRILPLLPTLIRTLDSELFWMDLEYRQC